MSMRKNVLIVVFFALLLGFHGFLLIMNGYGIIGSLLASPQMFGYLLLFVLGIVCLWHCIFLSIDHLILKTVAEPDKVKPRGRIAVQGTIESRNDPLLSPFGGKLCVLYDYCVYQKVEEDDQLEAEGWASVPSAIHGETHSYDMEGYPVLKDFKPDNITHNRISLLRQYAARTTFTKPNRYLTLVLRKVADWLPFGSRLLFMRQPDETGTIKADIDIRIDEESFHCDSIKELVVSQGASVIAIGQYGSKNNTLVPGWLGLRLFSGETGVDDIRASLKTEIKLSAVGALFFVGSWLLVFKLMDMKYFYQILFG